ncbi:MAG TPA: DUF4328 domain-containing protein [Jatrophihabitans sp.]|nr:DUF4328 domain-containing protein [Jatrophihabitans sp.]
MTDAGPPPGREHDLLAGDPTYPQGADAAYPPYPAYPPTGYGPAYPRPAARAAPLRGLAIATQVLLGVQLAAYLGLIVALVHEHTLVGQLANDPASVQIGDLRNADDAVAAVSVVVVLLLLATAVVWIIWFYRARANVDTWNAGYQRYPKGWAIGSWLCPIVNLWIPYQIAWDVLDNSERTETDASGWRDTYPLLTAWWIGWIAAVVLSAIVSVQGGDLQTVDNLSGYLVLEIVNICLRIITGVLAIFVVARITAAQTARMRRG